MSNEQIINTLKGISSILTISSEIHLGEINGLDFGIQLLNNELNKCIKSLEENLY